MLDRLPVELLQHILRLAHPAQFDIATYFERRTGLRNLSLVSKRVKGVAQPMLPEVVGVWEDPEGRLDQPKKDRQPRMCEIRAMLMKLSSDSPFRAPSVQTGQWARLEELIVYKGELRWDQLGNCTALRHLTLRDCRVQHLSPSLRFPHLVQLACVKVTIDPSDLHTIFSRFTLPSLKVFYMHYLFNSANPSFDTLVVDPMSWGNQLLALSMSGLEAGKLPVTFLSLPHLLVVMSICIDTKSKFQTLPAHFRLTVDEEALNSVDPTSGLPHALGTLTSVLRSVPSTGGGRLKVLVLPRSLGTLPDGHRHAHAVRGLLKECARCTVEVLWDRDWVGPDRGGGDFWYTPQSFIDYRRRRIREEADKEANKEVNEAA